VPEPLDLYIDTYQVSTNPYGCTINFSLSQALPTAPGTPPRAEPVASVRMSLENMKLLAFFLYRQMMQHERNLGVEIQVPKQVLNAVQIGPEDWQGFWKGHGGIDR
jgi:hypothetical protein